MTRHNKRFTWLEYPVTELDDHTTRDRVTFGFLAIIPCRRRYDVATDDNVRHQPSIIHFGDHKTQYRSLRPSYIRRSPDYLYLLKRWRLWFPPSVIHYHVRIIGQHLPLMIHRNFVACSSFLSNHRRLCVISLTKSESKEDFRAWWAKSSWYLIHTTTTGWGGVCCGGIHGCWPRQVCHRKKNRLIIARALARYLFLYLYMRMHTYTHALCTVRIDLSNRKKYQ